MNGYSLKLLQNLEQLSLEQLSHERKKKYTMFINIPWKKCKINQKEKNKKEKLDGSILNVLKSLLHTGCGRQTTIK